MNKLPDQPIRTCPDCRRKYQTYPAISRHDNKTEICPECGTLEALDNFFGFQNPNRKRGDLK